MPLLSVGVLMAAVANSPKGCDNSNECNEALSAITNISTLRTRLSYWSTNSCANNISTECGDVDSWDVSRVTNFDNTFDGIALNNHTVESWDVSRGTSFVGTFSDAATFNRNLNAWDVSKATSMHLMFYEAAAFNQDINAWNVQWVGNMNSMFRNAHKFNRDLNAWNTHRVTSTIQMFNNAYKFNGNISTWNTGNLVVPVLMFSKATAFNQNLNAWDTSKVAQMEYMFFQATAFNGDISAWNTLRVTNMQSMFEDAVSFNQNLSSWDLSQSPTTTSMFDSCPACATNQAHFDVSCVTTTTTVSSTTTTKVTCDAGSFRNGSLNVCAGCPAGQYQPHHAVSDFSDDVVACKAHTNCAAGEILLFAGTSMTNNVCGTHDSNACAEGEYVAGQAVNKAGSWSLHCNSTAGDGCPWSLLTTSSLHYLTFAANGALISTESSVVERLRQFHTANNTEKLLHVRLCEAWTSCLASNNEYMHTPGTSTSDRTCTNCPWLCKPTVTNFAVDSRCNFSLYGAAGPPYSECLEAVGNNVEYCCPVSFDRTVYRQGVSARSCPNPFHSMTDTCTVDDTRLPLLPVTTTTTTGTTVTSTTTTLGISDLFRFRVGGMVYTRAKSRVKIEWYLVAVAAALAGVGIGVLVWRAYHKRRARGLTNRKKNRGRSNFGIHGLGTKTGTSRGQPRRKAAERGAFPWTYKSKSSAIAAFSFLSAVTVGCALTLGGVLSVASIGSIASVGSVGSVGSLLSFNSTFSVLAHSCAYGLFHDCRKNGPEILRSRVPRKNDPYSMWLPCKRLAKGATVTSRAKKGSVGVTLSPGAVGKCGGDKVHGKERVEFRTGHLSQRGSYNLTFDMQVTTTASVSTWLSVFQIKCTKNGPPPYMLLLGSQAHPNMLQVRQKPSWQSTSYHPLLNHSDWMGAKRLRVSIAFNFAQRYIRTSVEGRNGERGTMAYTGDSYCEGKPYFKFGLYRDGTSPGGTATLGVGDIILLKL